ncbi:MAG: hypothetical protein MN733_20335 [Nitrososphaera sp.]|nr:hypothetical protein [Nitrososphaera sp.]
MGDVFDDLAEVAEWADLPEAELLIGRDILNEWYLALRGPEWSGRISSTPFPV